MGEFAHGLFGCFDDCGTCLMSYFLPCYTFGTITEAAGTASCALGTILFFVPLVNIFCFVNTRMAMREQHGIMGSCTEDVLMTLFCGFCSIVQLAQQIKVTPGASVART
ncbi:uncharacterized protein LOC134818461 [Bolinopsis microptera]|uniref:uncharacterized protein LOC134818406 n=1 Tax=Bolinopsis microptera TaxID=2820187 RepID=UPI003079ED61